MWGQGSGKGSQGLRDIKSVEKEAILLDLYTRDRLLTDFIIERHHHHHHLFRSVQLHTVQFQ